ncbi:MAG: hypothetical protein KatS3mg109_0733 [Pirellulaceae bacterium]|nr:MAG: hypothetical protein KatS3mg109_0733 [Pirellulaceae bacterium]
MNRQEPQSERQSSFWGGAGSVSLVLAEWLLIVLVYAAYAGCPPPDVNESYYLVKAKHYWLPDWCQRDLFVRSADVHTFFYATVGWFTSVLSLERAAYAGRLAAWGVLAWGWLRLSRALTPVPLMAALSAGWFLLLTGIRMAGEWVVGGVEAKVFAYGFVFAGLGCWLKQQLRWCWLYWGVAVLWHPLVGGWTWIAALLAAVATREIRGQWKHLLPWSVVGLAVGFPGLWWATAALRAPVSHEEAIQAARITVYERLAHHLAFHTFSRRDMAALGLVACMSIGWGAWMGKRRASCRQLARFTAAVAAIALAGVVIDQSLLWNLDLAARLLKFYWFRLADAVVPVTAALLVTQYYCELCERDRRKAEYYLVIILLIPVVVLGWKIGRELRDTRPRADRRWDATAGDRQLALRKYRNWLAACGYIREHLPKDALFLTPFNQQTFKWHAERAEVVNWKDFPQDPASILEWKRRMDDLFPNTTARSDITYWRDNEIIEKMRRYGAEYLVLERLPGASRTLGPAFTQVYPRFGDVNEDFVVYRIAP